MMSKKRMSKYEYMSYLKSLQFWIDLFTFELFEKLKG
jgi:hypothetical protein